MYDTQMLKILLRIPDRLFFVGKTDYDVPADNSVNEQAAVLDK